MTTPTVRDPRGTDSRFSWTAVLGALIGLALTLWAWGRSVRWECTVGEEGTACVSGGPVIPTAIFAGLATVALVGAGVCWLRLRKTLATGVLLLAIVVAMWTIVMDPADPLL